MPLNERALNGMADWLAGAALYLGLHSADPGPNGDNETTAPRLLANWSAPLNGALLVTERVFQEGEPNGPVTHLGLWSARTGGLFYGSGALTGDLRFNPNGTYHITNLLITGASGG